MRRTSRTVRTGGVLGLGAAIAVALFARTSHAQPVPAPSPAPAPSAPSPPAAALPPSTSGDDLLMPVLPASEPAPLSTAAPASAATASPAPALAAPPSARPTTPGEATSLEHESLPRRLPLPLPRPERLHEPFSIEPEITRWDGRRGTAERAKTAEIVGINVFGWPYLVSLIVGAVQIDSGPSKTDELGWLVVPVLGPLLTAVTLPGVDDIGRGVLVTDSALQAAGLVTTLIAHMIKNNAAKGLPRDTARRGTFASIQLAPVVLPAGGGVGLGGSF